MYPAQEQLSSVTVLSDRLRQDTSGELLTSLVAELRQAEQQIRKSMQQSVSNLDGRALNGLLEAVNLSEQTIAEVWEQVHQRTAPV